MIRLSVRTLGHLGRRLWGSLRAEPLDDGEHKWVRLILLESEFTLWSTMDRRDQRHSLHVAQRFCALLDRSGDFPVNSLDEIIRREAIAAALLHDVGKTRADLSTLERVAATVFRGRTKRFRSYLEHEMIGLELCQSAGSTPGTLKLLQGAGEPKIQELLRRADDI